MTRAGAKKQQRQHRPECHRRRQPAPPRRALVLIGVVGPLGYLALVTILGLLWDGYDPIRDTQE
jgi:hypothetical protein